MRLRSFLIAYALVLAILLFAERRPAFTQQGSTQQNHYSHVVDLTNGQSMIGLPAAVSGPGTRIIAPGALIPGTWTAGQIPPERLVAPLVVMDLAMNVKGAPAASSQISLDEISAWESQNGMIPPGAVVAIRRAGAASNPPLAPLPIARDAAQFLIEARSTIGFAVETPVTFASDRTLAEQLALHGNYVVEGAASLAALPATGSLIIVAPEKNKRPGEPPVRILAMVR